MRYDQIEPKEIIDALNLLRNGVKGSTMYYGLASGKCHLPAPTRKSMRITKAIWGILIITTLIFTIWQSQF
jgi:hypothetical protein